MYIFNQFTSFTICNINLFINFWRKENDAMAPRRFGIETFFDFIITCTAICYTSANPTVPIFCCFIAKAYSLASLINPDVTTYHLFLISNSFKFIPQIPQIHHRTSSNTSLTSWEIDGLSNILIL